MLFDYNFNAHSTLDIIWNGRINKINNYAFNHHTRLTLIDERKRTTCNEAFLVMFDVNLSLEVEFYQLYQC